ncbi:MAG: type I polyketide synthase, partial [bacterium]|nr:type I polyketide synthase [bacterium]
MFETDEDYNENENHDEYSDSGESDIAVIGMACRFPGAKDVNGFWENLKNGVESVSFFTEEELETAGIGREAFENPNFIKTRGGMLEEHQCFDASFFGYSPREAQVMDPQVRVFHECCWGALEDAGYDPMTYEGLTGLYAGAASNAYWQVITHFSSQTDDLGGLLSNYLNNRDFMCTNIAYRLNLKGPAVMVQTACSTALVAIHMATQALLNGECDMALAGGVSILDSPAPGYVFSEGSILSNDGHCRSFDAKAKGTVTGSGAGVMVLKSMEEALKDRDHIYAVIKATAINNDGVRKVGYTAPSPEGQSEVINVVHQMAEVEPESIGYVETHGSATFLGDSIEIEALKLAFNTERKGFCSLGAVKTNFGHLNTAAGAAGFIKTVLAIFHRQLPPTLHYETPNPRLDLENSPFYVNTRLKKWEHNGSPLRAGVSSFGIGGTNAHLLLEEAPELDYQPETSQPRLYQLLLLSAKTGPALERVTQRLADHLKSNPAIHLPDVAYTLQTGRGHFTHRRMLVSPDTEEAVRLLSSPDSRKVRSAFSTVENPPVIFMFSGLGSEYVNMGADLYQWEPAFAEEMDRCFGILSEAAGVDFKKAIYPGGDGGAELEIPDEAVQPLMFSFQYALARMLMKWGIKPRAMTGYSFGEYIAACIAGVFSLEDALKLVIARARLVRKAPEGMMLSVPVTKEEVIPLLKGNKKLSLAIDNGPSCIVAGVTEAVEAFETQMKEKRMMSMRLSNRHALHSMMMEPVLKEFEEMVRQFDLKKPQIPYVSNVSGHWIAANDAVSPAYWARHLGETVYFADGIRQLLGEKNAIFIEIGPGRDLTALMSRYVTEDSGQKVLNLIRPRDRDISDVYYLLNKIGHLWLYRGTIDWNRFHAHREHARVPLPTYPFER